METTIYTDNGAGCAAKGFGASSQPQDIALEAAKRRGALFDAQPEKFNQLRGQIWDGESELTSIVTCLRNVENLLFGGGALDGPERKRLGTLIGYLLNLYDEVEEGLTQCRRRLEDMYVELALP